jgi:hypothetical protein
MKLTIGEKLEIMRQTGRHSEWQDEYDEFCTNVLDLEYHHFKELSRLLKQHVLSIPSLCTCTYCRGEFEVGNPVEAKDLKRCPKCSKYFEYLKRFDVEKRYEILRNRKCIDCRINPVETEVVRSRRCPACRDLRAMAVSTESHAARAFFQAMAMVSPAQNNKENN